MNEAQMTTVEVSTSPVKLWMAAIKPPMYSVAVMPIWVGTAMAIAQTERFDRGIFLTFLSSAIAILAWLNLSNDVFDSETGIDKNKAHSIVNLTGNKSLIFGLANVLLGLGILGILMISWWQQDPTVVAIVIVCCALGYTYQGPPFRLGYLGLGEIICFFAFGPFAVAAAYYSQTQSWTAVSASGLLPLVVASVFIGITTSLILFCSHFHQVEDDLAAGKRSPIVRMGTANGARLLPWLTGIPFVAIAASVAFGILPVPTLLTFASLPFAIHLCRHVGANHDKPNLVSNCKFIAVRLHFVSGLLLGWGLIQS